MKNKTNPKISVIAGSILTVVALVMSIVGVLNYEVVEGATKINEKDPMFPLIFAGIILLILGLIVLAEGVIKLTAKEETRPLTTHEQVVSLVQAALFAALAYVLFMFFKIDISLPGGQTAFHLGNTMVVLAALLLGGTKGGLAGALGLTIADLTTSYVTSAPKTFFLKLCIGLIVGIVAHGIFKITKTKDRKKVVLGTVVSVVAGLLFNVVADPLVGYFYKLYLFGIPQDAAKALQKIATLTTAVNALLSGAIAIVLYLALRPVLIKAGLFIKISPKKDEK